MTTLERETPLTAFQICLRDTKGNEDRVTLLPEQLIPLLHEHLRHVQALHQADLKAGFGAVYLPDALERKYPNANKERGWQYICPACNQALAAHHLHSKSFRETHRSRQARNLLWRCQ